MDRPLNSPNQLQPGTVALLGVPWDENSTFMQGPAQAPPRIREALHSGSSNLCAENGVDLDAESRFQDMGDLDLRSDPLDRIEHETGALLARGARILALGGDHAVSYPVIKAYAREYGRVQILHFDAHPDLYQEFEGNRLSHACPFARIMEDGLADRLVQIGIRGMNLHQREQARRFGVEVVDMMNWSSGPPPVIEGPLYLSLDLDVLDPAFAPGVSHHEPGGLSTREVIRVLHSLGGPIIGADIVEFNPKRDPLGITAMVAAKFVKEIAGLMITSEG